ncbi:MAG: hypothetical protein ABJD07_15240 [Gemmatimonadaceae bacterium]
MRRTATLVGAMALLAGCSDSPTATKQQQDLEALRRVTTPFQNFQAATTSGWSAKITPCMSDPSGGMGYHYGNTALIDGSVSVEQPELLLYEPDQAGTLRLVAVEYIVPYSAHSRSDAPPVLFGREFKKNDTFQLWGLHVWAWKENANGLYADWNPQVSCANAADVSSMVH